MLLHSAVVGLLLINWQAESSEPTRIEPLYISAALIRQNPIQIRRREEMAAKERAEQQKAKEIASRRQARESVVTHKKLVPVETTGSTQNQAEASTQQAPMVSARQEPQRNTKPFWKNRHGHVINACGCCYYLFIYFSFTVAKGP